MKEQTEKMRFNRPHCGILAAMVFCAAALAGSAQSTQSQAPRASFKMSTNLGVAPFTVKFTDTSSKKPAAWFWTFGDGGTSTQRNPSHTFTNMWRQTVTLTVSNAHGTSTASQPVFQCFPCDALYDWTGGTPGQPASPDTMAKSLAPGANVIGRFTVTNKDLPSPNLQGLIFTNLPTMTNGCPVVFSNGVIDANFHATNALAYSWTNDFEQYTFTFNTNLVITNIVLLFYDSMPLSRATWSYCVDELNIATTRTRNMGLYCLNRDLGISGPLFPHGVNENNCHTSETCVPTTYGRSPGATNKFFDGTHIFEYPNKLYRILMQENTNGDCILAVGDPVTGSLQGFVTNYNTYERGHLIVSYCNGHTSWEIYTNNGLGTMVGDTSILACHSIISLNRPLTWYQATNIAMYGP